MKFKIGDVVVLKSGGPAMTVNSDKTQVRERVLVGVVWFNEKYEQQSAIFSEDALELESENDL